MLSEINIAPRILTNFTGVMPSQFKKDLDSYLKTRSPVTFLSELRSNLQVSRHLPDHLLQPELSHLKDEDDEAILDVFFFLQVSNEPGNRYNIQLINALVLYVGTQAIAHIHNKGSTPSMSTITHSAHMDIFQNLAVDLDTEGGECRCCVFVLSLVDEGNVRPCLNSHYFGISRKLFVPLDFFRIMSHCNHMHLLH